MNKNMNKNINKNINMNKKSKCSCSKYCRIHSENRKAIIEFGYKYSGIKDGHILYSIHPNSNNKTKELLCKIINDKAINKICKDHSLIVDTLNEMEYNKSEKCLGKNKNKNKIFITLRNQNGKFLNYTDIISIILHELAHYTQ